MASNMQRTKAELKKYGIIHQVVERYFPPSKKYPFGFKEDLLNIIDVIALDNGIVGIQVCGSDLNAHKRKIMVDKRNNTIAWLTNNGRLEVWAWRKLKKVRGGKAMYWAPRIIDILIVDGELYWEERG